MRTLVISLALLVCLQGAHAQSTLLPGEAAFDLGDFAKARKELAAEPGFGTQASLVLMQTRIELAENKLDEARKLVDKVIETDSNNALAYALRGQLYGMKASRASLFRAGGYAKKSLASYESALELDPDLEEALVGLIRYRLSAPTLFGGSIDKASKTAEHLKQVNPVDGGLELAAIYGKQKEDVRRVELLQQIAKDHPQDPRASVALGFIEQASRNYDQAGDYFAAAVTAASSSPEHTYSAQAARYQMGRTVVLSKSDRKAEVEKGIAVLSDYLAGPWYGDLPDFEWAHYRRGLLYERLIDKNAEAEQDFTQAAKTDDRDLQRALGSR